MPTDWSKAEFSAMIVAENGDGEATFDALELVTRWRQLPVKDREIHLFFGDHDFGDHDLVSVHGFLKLDVPMSSAFVRFLETMNRTG